MGIGAKPPIEGSKHIKLNDMYTKDPRVSSIFQLEYRCMHTTSLPAVVRLVIHESRWDLVHKYASCQLTV
jgi:hypothetical protein